METVTLFGTYGGKKVSVAFESEEESDGRDVGTKTQQAIAYYESKGFSFSVATAQAPQGGGNFAQRMAAPQGGAAPQQPQGRGMPSWQCPEHGTENIKPGYGGRGFECGVKSDTEPNWAWRPGKDKQTNAWLPYTFMGKEGPVFACKWKSN